MKCPHCNEELEFVDDSFSHDKENPEDFLTKEIQNDFLGFGTEIIQYYYCYNCDKEINIEDLE